MIAGHAAPTSAPSEPVPSCSGETFSSLPSTLSDNNVTTRSHRAALLGLWTAIFSPDHNTIPVHAPHLEIDGHPQRVTSRPPAPGPLPWLYQFSWTNGTILFDGDPLSTALERRWLSELGDATCGDGDSIEPSATLSASFADNVSCVSGDSVALRRVVFERGEIQDKILGFQALLLAQLEAHWRSHPPQRSASRAKGKCPTSKAQQPPDTRVVSGPYTKRGPSESRRKIGQGSGDEDEDNDDDDDEDDSDPASATLTLNTPSHWYACPYQKWKPQHFLLTCGTGFRRITDVKTHLREKHYAYTCSQCGNTFNDKIQLRLHVSETCLRPFKPHVNSCYMTDKQLAAIKTHFGGKRMSHHEQWEHLFRILFPNEPLPSSPYLPPQQEQVRTFLQDWICWAGRKILDDIHFRTLSENPDLNQHQSKEAQLREVMRQFITLVVEETSEEGLLVAIISRCLRLSWS